MRDARRAGVRIFAGSPLTSISPAVGAVGAVQQPHELGPARAEQAGEADDLAG